jgi:hypothetical protein
MAALDVAPGFHLLPAAPRLWARLRFGRASPDDLRELSALAHAVCSAAEHRGSRRVLDRLLAARTSVQLLNACLHACQLRHVCCISRSFSVRL